MAELADALDSGSSGSNLVEVQVLSPALFLFLALDLSDFSERSFFVLSRRNFITENKKAVVISYHSSVSVSALFAIAKLSLIPHGTKPAKHSFYAKARTKEH